MTRTTDTPDLLALRRFGSIPSPDDYPADSLERAVAADVTAVAQVVQEFEAELARLKATKHYSPEGLRHRAGELAAGPLARITKAEGDLRRHYEPRLEELRASVAVTRSPDQAITAELRRAEVRGLLAAMDPADALTEFQRAIEEGDKLTFEAVSEAPGPYRFFGLPLDLLELGRERWAERQAPEAARQARAVEGLVRKLDNAVKAARETVHELAEMEPPDALATALEKASAA